MLEILVGVILLVLLWKFGLLGFLDTILSEVSREVRRAKNQKREAEEIYRGTRVVEVAQRMHEDIGRDPDNFWYCDRDYEFRLAQEQLAANPNCWGPMYKWKRGVQKLLSPLARIAQALNTDARSHKWRCRLYFLSNAIDWRTGNWNIVGNIPISLWRQLVYPEGPSEKWLRKPKITKS